MRILNHFLGAVAKANLALWRYRINFVPLNVPIILGLGALGVASWSATAEALRNSEAPLQVSLEQIRATPIAQNYVSVSGLAIPEAVYEYGDTAANGELTSVDRSWFPLVDGDSRRVLLVQREGKLPGGQPREETVIGMLRDLTTNVQASLAADGYQLEGFPVETRYMLVDGERPGSPWLYGIATGLIVFTLVCVAIATGLRNTIFQRSDRIRGMPINMDPNQSALVNATGRFVLDAKTGQRFVDMPATLGGRDGSTILTSNIDASSRFMGFVTSKRSGIWTVSGKPRSIADGEFGYQYFGLGRRHAFRFSYADPTDGKRRTAIVAANDISLLDHAAAVLGVG
jgi:hypothetical protein